jgi:hypothetical protein
MTQSQATVFYYYFIVIAVAVHIVLLFVETRTYRRTRIQSLVPMIVANVIGLLYVGTLVARTSIFVPRTSSFTQVALLGASLYLAEVVVGVWGTVNFLNAVQRLAAVSVDKTS